MRIVLTGGGTGGHIYPALSLWNYLKERHPNAEVLYIGTERGLERDIVGRLNIPFVTISATGLKRQLSFAAVKTVITTYQGYRMVKQQLRAWQPDVVLGTGGYVTLPVVFAATKLQIPTVIWEGNARPGLTNRLCAKRAQAVATSFADSSVWLKGAKKIVCTGNPRASEVQQVDVAALKQARKRYNLVDGQPLILIFSGSRGAQTVNKTVVQLLTRFAHRPNWRVIFITGEQHYDAVRASATKLPDHITILPFVYDMPCLLPNADVVITRAGSATLAEICALGVASILIPSPYVTANHQEENAKRLAQQNAAVLLREAELTPDILRNQIIRLVDGKEGQAIRKHALQMATPNAVQDLYQLVINACHVN